MSAIYLLPIVTFSVAIFFSIHLYRHWLWKRHSLHLLWWMLGVMNFGISTFTESFNTLFGWQEWNFRTWYISGALIGGGPMAQGTVYLLMNKKVAHVLTALFGTAVVVASVCVWRSPVDYSMVEPLRMNGDVFVWQWVRWFSPFLNSYALAFLAGGAIYSAVLYFRKRRTLVRFWGNVLIAIGAILPGFGGVAVRAGHVELLYITELLGLLLIFMGYLVIRKDRTRSVHLNQQARINAEPK